MQRITNEKVLRFLYESNAIEREYGSKAFEDAIKAWKVTYTTPVRDMHYILAIHRILMRRLNPRIAGQLRHCTVMVGGRVCPDPVLVYPLLEDWIAEHMGAKTEVAIKEAHIAFEKIHPFVDGNGRTGRIIMNAQRVDAGLPILVIHEGNEQIKYYEWFK